MSSYGSLIDLDIIDWYEEMPKGNSENYLGMDIGSTTDRSAIVTAKRFLDTTYIDDIMVEDHQEHNMKGIFSLNGQRLDAPQKGINIINGKKVFMK